MRLKKFPLSQKALTKKFLNAKTKQSKLSSTTFFEFIETMKATAHSNPDEPFTVIYLSDGMNLKNPRYHRKDLANFVRRMPANLNIYASAISDKNNVEMLETVAELGKGELIYAKTHSAFARKFTKNVQTISKPIFFDLHLSAASPDALVNLTPQKTRPFYYGYKKSLFFVRPKAGLTNVDVLLQGRTLDNRYFNYRTTLYFDPSSDASKKTNQTYAKQKALGHFLRFLKTNSQEELSQAQKLLNTYTTAK